MHHARHRSPLRVLSGRAALPAVLLTAVSTAFAGLALVSVGPEPDQQGPDVLAASDTPVTVFVPRDDDLDKASRSRERRPSPTPSAKPAVKPAPKPKPKPKATVKPKPRPKPAVRATRKPAASTRIAGRCPVPSATFTDTWGAPRSGGRSHQGTDLLADYGAPVYAVADGVVDTTSSSNGGISLYLRARNGEKYFYAHNAENIASDGERVEAGELIARVGSTGNAGDTNHVHFEREVNGTPVNPYAFLRRIC